jgi:hypothetical protein
MTLDEQIAELTRTGSGTIIHLARPGVLVAVAGLVLAGAWTGNPVFCLDRETTLRVTVKYRGVCLCRFMNFTAENATPSIISFPNR